MEYLIPILFVVFGVVGHTSNNTDQDKKKESSHYENVKFNDAYNEGQYIKKDTFYIKKLEVNDGVIDCSKMSLKTIGFSGSEKCGY